MKIGILVHGKHVEAEGWEQMVWGEPPKKLGALPMMILTVLNRGVENIGKIVFGTGASERDGLKEAEIMKKFLFSKLVYYIRDFETIKKHPKLQSISDVSDLVLLMNNIVCETTSKNTTEEIAAAAKIFTEANIAEVIQITCASHAPRCIRDSAVAAEKGLIPESQIWSVIRDMTTFVGTSASDVVVIEPPHRGDDPMIKAAIKPHQVFSGFFKIPGKARECTLYIIDKFIKSAAKHS